MKIEVKKCKIIERQVNGGYDWKKETNDDIIYSLYCLKEITRKEREEKQRKVMLGRERGCGKKKRKYT